MTPSVAPTAQNEPNRQEDQQASMREHRHGSDGHFRYLPADSYTDDGELLVFTQPLSSGTQARSAVMVRHAVHDVVNVNLTSCMELQATHREVKQAFVIRQHSDGTCDVRLAIDLATTFLSVPTTNSTYVPCEVMRAHLREYEGDMHGAADLYTESGAHVSRHATSVMRMNDGAAGGSARSHNDA